MIAALFPEEVHLVVAANSDIQSVDDLRGKRVLLGQANTSGAGCAAAPFWPPIGCGRGKSCPTRRPRPLLKDGKIDAYFAVAGVPLDSIRDLLAHHQARLVPIDGEGRDRLLQMVPQLFPGAIPAGSLSRRTGAVETVATRAWWVTRDSEPDPLDLWPDARAVQSRQSRRPGRQPSQRARNRAWTARPPNPPAPLHPGAARFYRETGKLH